MKAVEREAKWKKDEAREGLEEEWERVSSNELNPSSSYANCLHRNEKIWHIFLLHVAPEGLFTCLSRNWAIYIAAAVMKVSWKLTSIWVASHSSFVFIHAAPGISRVNANKQDNTTAWRARKWKIYEFKLFNNKFTKLFVDFSYHSSAPFMLCYSRTVVSCFFSSLRFPLQ